MHVKRYRRKSMLDALRAVRADLGPDALILTTREVPLRGPRGWMGAREVEVTAAAEPSRVSADRHLASEDRAMALELDCRPDAAGDPVVGRLQAAGLDETLARDIAAACPARRRGVSSRALEQTLARELAALAAPAEERPAVEAFVGPPGVGKTTTIAKIAAQERARHGRRLHLVAADGFRVGAVEQLRIYADIIGSRLTTARTPDDLDTALAEARGPLLVDTAGRSPADATSREMFAVLAGRSVRVHLVLPASLSPGEARRAFDRFAEARPARVVLTRLDEVASIGPLVRVLREAQVPLSFFGTGQHVPEDLRRVTPVVLAQGILCADARGEAA
jgi:flagellar biosynthesis protein FlhF